MRILTEVVGDESDGLGGGLLQLRRAGGRRVRRPAAVRVQLDLVALARQTRGRQHLLEVPGKCHRVTASLCLTVSTTWFVYLRARDKTSDIRSIIQYSLQQIIISASQSGHCCFC